VFDELCRRQRGMVSRQQARRCGITDDTIRAHLDSGRWRRLFEGTYCTFSGPLPRDCLLWGVVLRMGRGALLSHETAAELAGLIDQPYPTVHVTVPASRRVTPPPLVRVHTTARAAQIEHPSRLPPQSRVDETVVDLTQSAATPAEAMGWIARACGRRLTTADRIRDALSQRKKLRWRQELTATVADVGLGCHSVLEVRYLRDVERAHRLPTGVRQHSDHTAGVATYDDVRYDAYRLSVELDGRTGHSEEGRFRDMRRDNARTCDGHAVLRYGWVDVVGRPCEVAAQVAEVLASRGWAGTPRRCGATCRLLW